MIDSHLRCNTLQHTTIALQHTATHRKYGYVIREIRHYLHDKSTVTTLAWKHSHTLQQTSTHCNTLQHPATPCNALQHTATPCNALQCTATHCNSRMQVRVCSMAWLIRVWHDTFSRDLTYCSSVLPCVAVCCNALQHTATHCNTLQHTATLNGGVTRHITCKCVMSRVNASCLVRLKSFMILQGCFAVCVAECVVVCVPVCVAVWLKSFMMIQGCDTESDERDNSCICVTWQLRTYAMTHRYDLTYSYVWHDCFTWLTTCPCRA